MYKSSVWKTSTPYVNDFIFNIVEISVYYQYSENKTKYTLLQFVLIVLVLQFQINQRH